MYLMAFEFTDLVIPRLPYLRIIYSYYRGGFSQHVLHFTLNRTYQKTCSPVEAKVCLEENVARFCVLLAVAEIVNNIFLWLLFVHFNFTYTYSYTCGSCGSVKNFQSEEV